MTGARWPLGIRLRGLPMSSRCSYWTGASVPITGERGEPRRPALAHLGIEQARRQAAALDVAEHGAGRVRLRDRRLAAEPRERQRALRVDLADARARRSWSLSGKLRKPGGGRARVEAVDRPTASTRPAFFTSRPSSRSTPASSCWLMSVTIVRRPASIFSRISTTLPIAPSSPFVILRSCEDGRDEVVDERPARSARPRRSRRCRDRWRRWEASRYSASSRMTSSEPP